MITIFQDVYSGEVTQEFVIETYLTEDKNAQRYFTTIVSKNYVLFCLAWQNHTSLQVKIYNQAFNLNQFTVFVATKQVFLYTE